MAGGRWDLKGHPVPTPGWLPRPNPQPWAPAGMEHPFLTGHQEAFGAAEAHPQNEQQ